MLLASPILLHADFLRSLSPQIQLLLFSSASFALKPAMMGMAEVAWHSCSKKILLYSILYFPSFHASVSEPLTCLLPPASCAPHISVLHPIYFATFLAFSSRFPDRIKESVINNNKKIMAKLMEYLECIPNKDPSLNRGKKA